jgi:hypothetical protein
VRFADGSLQRVFYNGYTTAELNAGTGLKQLIERQARALKRERGGRCYARPL